MKFLYNLLFLSFFQNQGFQMLKIYIWLKSIQSFHAKWAKLVLQGKGTNVDGNKRKSKGQRQIEKAYRQGGGTEQARYMHSTSFTGSRWYWFLDLPHWWLWNIHMGKVMYDLVIIMTFCLVLVWSMLCM